RHAGARGPPVSRRTLSALAAAAALVAAAPAHAEDRWTVVAPDVPATATVVGLDQNPSGQVVLAWQHDRMGVTTLDATGASPAGAAPDGPAVSPRQQAAIADPGASAVAWDRAVVSSAPSLADGASNAPWPGVPVLGVGFTPAGRLVTFVEDHVALATSLGWPA